MPTHDIIDNRKQKLVDHINRILSSTEAARFAVGYFFLSGLESIAARLAGMKELRLLIGNTTNRETLEQIAEGYRRLELVAEAREAETYPKRADTKWMTGETAQNIRSAMELMDQTDEAQAVVTTLVRMIEEKRLKVKVYTKGRLHAKAYIFDYGKVYGSDGKPVERHEEGIAIVGSSNLTLSGVTHNTELNVVVQGNDNHAELVRWFDELWKEAEDFDETLMQEMKQSWAVAPVRPYDVYMKTLYTLVRDRLEGEDDKDILWHPQPWSDADWKEYDERFGKQLDEWLDAGLGSRALARPDVREAVRDCLMRFDGERLRIHAAVIMPTHVHALIEPLAKGDTGIPACESTQSRSQTRMSVSPSQDNPQTRMSVSPCHSLSELMKGIKGASARAANNILGTSGTFWMDESFNHIVRSEAQYERFVQYIADNPLKARLRGDEYWLYENVTQAFRPVHLVHPPEPEPQTGMSVPPCLTYARYGLWHYIKPEKQKREPYASLQRAGATLRGLIRILLFKRFESSVFAFKETVRRLLVVHERFLKALDEGFVPAGDDAQAILYEPNQDEEQDLMDALRKVSGRYDIADFDLPKLKTAIAHDVKLLKKMLELVEPITPERSGHERPAVAQGIQRRRHARAAHLRRRSETPASRTPAYIVPEPRPDVRVARTPRPFRRDGG